MSVMWIKESLDDVEKEDGMSALQIVLVIVIKYVIPLFLNNLLCNRCSASAAVSKSQMHIDGNE